MRNIFDGVGELIIIGILTYTAVIIGLVLIGVGVSHHVHIQTHVRFN